METIRTEQTTSRKPEIQPIRPVPVRQDLPRFAVDDDPDCATLFVVRERRGAK